jgi:alkylmercury lyase-like protein
MNADASLTDEQVEAIRLHVYREFARTGRAPHHADLASAAGVSVRDVPAGLAQLARQRHLVLGPEGAIVMAHPFSSINLGFSVMGRSTLWWGGCAWDSFAIPHLVPDEADVLVATTCLACGAAHAWTVTRKSPPAGAQLAHFLIPAVRVWDDVVRACGNQRLFCGEACIASWLETTGHARGSVFDLATLWRLARHWYDGRLDTPYRRREPAEAKEYFREVGLTGSFWGL